MPYSELNLTALTLANETLKTSKDLILKQFITGGDFSKFHTIIPGVKFNREVGLLGELGTVGTARQTCKATPDVVDATADKKLWSQYNWEVFLEFCFSDLLPTIAQYDLKMGPDKGDLEGTVYFATIMNLIGIAINKMLWRVWLMDTAAAHSNDSPAGVISPATALKYMNIADGYWKQIYAIVAADPKRRITIAANSQGTHDLQDSALTPVLAWGYINSMIYGAKPALRAANKSDIWFGCTRSIWDKLVQHMQTLTIGVPQTFQYMVDGVGYFEAVKVNGYSILALDIWDEQIRQYEDNGTSYNKPHRAFFTTKNNILFGVPSGSIIETIKAFYVEKDELEYVRASDDFSLLILQNELTMTAY